MSEEQSAFPFATTENTVDYHGMSLRQWYASCALPSCLQGRYNHGLQDVNPATEMHEQKAVERAWRIADLMIKEDTR